MALARAGPGNHILETVWDGGGTDTYDLSNYTNDLVIDLRPGRWSTFSSAQLSHLDQYTGNTHVGAGNVANALLYNNDARSLIESAIGGPGSDVINGNAANNVLDGGNGGADQVNGATGNDTVSYAVSSRAVSLISLLSSPGMGPTMMCFPALKMPQVRVSAI